MDANDRDDDPPPIHPDDTPYVICADCGARSSWRYTKVSIRPGVGRAYCQPCADWRKERGLLLLDVARDRLL